jgi:regulatory protein YycI of two-component signal transduction system YycFG
LGPFPPVLYFVSWIFIGNFILLNLFLAILLDGFLSEDDEEEGDLEEIERLAKEHRQKQIEKEKTRRLKKLGASLAKKGIEADW